MEPSETRPIRPTMRPHDDEMIVCWLDDVITWDSSRIPPPAVICLKMMIFLVFYESVINRRTVFRLTLLWLRRKCPWAVWKNRKAQWNLYTVLFRAEGRWTVWLVLRLVGKGFKLQCSKKQREGRRGIRQRIVHKDTMPSTVDARLTLTTCSAKGGWDSQQRE